MDTVSSGIHERQAQSRYWRNNRKTNKGHGYCKRNNIAPTMTTMTTANAAKIQGMSLRSGDVISFIPTKSELLRSLPLSAFTSPRKPSDPERQGLGMSVLLDRFHRPAIFQSGIAQASSGR
jgi:hypothetical protein